MENNIPEFLLRSHGCAVINEKDTLLADFVKDSAQAMQAAKDPSSVGIYTPWKSFSMVRPIRFFWIQNKNM